jgi:hypothetical protein
MNPEAHAAYKQRFKDYRQKKKILYHNDPKAKEAARIKKHKTDLVYEAKRKLKRQQLKSESIRILSGDN